MKPFDLDKAKAGAPVVNRNGDCVTIASYNLSKQACCDFTVLALIHRADGDSFVLVDESGKYSVHDSSFDLFMASKKREGWINIYQRKGERRKAAMTIYPSEEAAKSHILSSHLATVKIEWEE